MKKSLLLSIAVFAIFTVQMAGQNYPHGNQHFADLHPDSVMRQDPRMAHMQFEPGEILVRFVDEINVSIFKSDGKAQTGLETIDALFVEYEVTEAKQLITGAQPLQEKQMLRSFTGMEFERPSLHNIYHLKFAADDYKMFELIEALKEDKNIIYAEPNYIYNLTGHEALSDKLTAEELAAIYPSKRNTGKGQQCGRNVVEPNDPLYDQQWWIEAVNAHLAWEQSTGDTIQVIAILDTGVDWQHPDLQNKIWNNPNETLNGQDSDGNGFVDDIRGWDFINNNNNPMDDNSHGTHVAGIAAAEADNGIGIAGVSWGAKIMPIKVLQSSGAGTVANVVQGVNYASENGATVINMSLGSYAYSMALEDALANAYANAVLVAAAGNDGLCIGPGLCPDMRLGRPMYPAAISYVLGVEASALFSNYDQDGPVYSAYPELFNYEMVAPGSVMISTIPNGGYRIYSGTSMAAPIVAGAASIYNSIYPNHSQELMWVNLIHTSSNHMDIHAALEGLEGSRLGIVSHMLVDTIYGGDADGNPDAGETIQLWYTLRNTGIQANDVHVGIRLGEFEDTSVVEIIDSLSYIGSISPYATRTNEQNPFKIAIADDVVHNRDIVFEAYAFNQGETDTIFQPLVLTVEHGTELSGVMDSTLTLYPNQLYLVNKSFRVGAGATLIIKPGTEIAVYPGYSIEVRGRVIANGTSDSLIVVRSNTHHGRGFIFNYGSGEPPSEFSYCHFYNLSNPIGLGSQGFAQFNRSVEFCVFESCSYPWGFSTFSNNIIKNASGDRLIDYVSGPIEFNNFYNSGMLLNPSPNPVLQAATINYNNFVNLKLGFTRVTEDWVNHSNNFIANVLGLIMTEGGADIIDITEEYWGSTSDDAPKSQVYDFWDDNSLPIANFHPMLEQPSPEAHGIVWKVLINGADAQDEFVEPVGVGPQRFDVYFNRPMDIDYTPNVSFGVRYPYNQQAVSDSMSWSADSTVFTAWKTIQLYTGDGINRVRVTDARDPEGFEIPPEYFRFEFLIDAAGAASIDFMAIPGMGKIELEWSHPETVQDLLGYNLYRFQHTTDTSFTDPILINPQLVLDTLYTDFAVEPGTKYYYYYKILRTNMSETDSSRVVNAIPHTAAPGDANGDYNVNVMDIVSIVAYMLNQNPQPFIFEAADVNQDGAINVMDIVGVVGLITNNKSGFLPKPSMHPDKAYVHFKDDIVQIESDGQLTAIEFTLLTAFPDQVELSSLLPGFELAWRKTAGGMHGFIFNMQNNCIPEGTTNIIRIQHKNPDLSWGEIFGADPDGQLVEILTETLDISEQRYLTDELQLDIFPNPARDMLNIEYSLPMAADVEVAFYDVFGRLVGSINFSAQQPGLNTHVIDTRSQNLSGGILFCRVTARGQNGGLLQKTMKVLLD
jgi:subtilisin family serine protease